MGLLVSLDRLIDFLMGVTQEYFKGVQSVEDNTEKNVDNVDIRK